MELEISSPKLGDLTQSDCNSDPDEKEVTDDDDDDRNHKHRRRETRSQSLERDVPDPVFTRPFRKRNKPFPNGNHFREGDSQSNAAWKNFNSNNFEKDFSGKFDKRRPGYASAVRSTLDLNQRFRPNQLFPGDPSLVRGRGRDHGLWNPRDARFSSDLASQVGSISPMFAGRGLPNVSNAQNAPWNAFGIIPGIPNGNLDTIHPIGLQGPLRPPLPSTLNIGIPRQRCRDFEERGFCLRGDMCPMEHGVNRIVIEDVQSLSQFNLPVSLPSTHLLGQSSGPGPGSHVSMSSSSIASINNKGLHSKTSRPGFADDGLGMNGSFSGADLYDPDQPLWNDSGPETSNALLGLHSSKTGEIESLTNGDPLDNEFLTRGVGNPAGSNVTSVWGRIGSSKGRLDGKEKTDPAVSSSDYPENESKEDNKMASAGIQSAARQGKRAVSEDAGPKPFDSSSVKAQFDPLRNTRKPSQKALRTLFVNGIPLQSNKREKLLSHFQKFGEVIDIHIPLNSERAFVQFSKREEAEAAFKAPDAVMGNRFIKLWWANRDSIPDNSLSSINHASSIPHGGVAASIPLQPHSSVLSGKNSQAAAAAAAPRNSMVQTHDASLHASDTVKPVATNGAKVVPPPQQQKKLEQLKEELRKKQEMLEQKRNEFRRKLVKLEKQATGSKGDLDSEQAAKRLRLAAEVADASTPRASDSVADKPVDKSKPGENTVNLSPKTTATLTMQEFTISKQHPVRPFAPTGSPFTANRYKIDNRPTAFRILPPLPAGFANVAVVREHFSPYGDISNVELEDVDVCNSSNESLPSKDCSARVSFLTRRAAEKAFTIGKSWQGHELKFGWLSSSTPRSDLSGGENSSSTSMGSLFDANVKIEEAPTGSQEVASSESIKPEDQEKRNADEEDAEETEQGQNTTSEKNETNEGGEI